MFFIIFILYFCLLQFWLKAGFWSDKQRCEAQMDRIVFWMCVFTLSWWKSTFLIVIVNIQSRIWPESTHAWAAIMGRHGRFSSFSAVFCLSFWSSGVDPGLKSDQTLLWGDACVVGAVWRLWVPEVHYSLGSARRHRDSWAFSKVYKQFWIM